MLLTDKTKEDFLKYYNNHSIRFLLSWTIFEDLPLVVQNALIIEWLDSVYFYVTIDREENMFIYTIDYPNDIYFSNWDDLYFETRSEATGKAIEKANK